MKKYLLYALLSVAINGTLCMEDQASNWLLQKITNYRNKIENAPDTNKKSQYNQKLCFCETLLTRHMFPTIISLHKTDNGKISTKVISVDKSGIMIRASNAKQYASPETILIDEDNNIKFNVAVPNYKITHAPQDKIVVDAALSLKK